MNKKSILSNLPSVDELLNDDKITDLIDEVPRKLVVNSIRGCLQNYRSKILNMKEQELENFQVDTDELIGSIIQGSKQFISMNLRKVINATGVVLHTNLGRALLSDEIKEEVWSVASGYSNLELNVATGKRGSRYSHVVEIIKYLTGAEDALVVNNNAAAVMLVLSTMAKEKEVVVSRGELVEIGGSFRVPDVMEQSGAKLVDVGTTNKTHLWDYEKALGEDTAALLKVHTSNYKILGFTEAVPLKDLVTLGRKNNVPVIEDLGSGVLVDLQKYGLTYEPTVQESVALGVDVVTFSGDKLLGGPQAGIIVGNKHWIDQMKKNPLTRAFRIDKLTMAALEATLKLYLDEEEMMEKIPTLKMLTESITSLAERAQKLYSILSSVGLSIEIKEDFSQVGGGSLPLEKLPTKVIAIKPSHLSVSRLEEKLRNYRIPIITRIQEDQLIIDLRTIKEEDYGVINEALKDAIGV
ncbi:L-seryl-tRNA(Sec) selenium transferase SelA [Clostridium aceticum]|uniref:L-seryl-tRNA(Sec) selenium transferase n=1 Tax=Clostridium aceticum TaxID=84022 RepID=A0A0D8ID37_9CLOT|nr:L-seryl-tRNA(Sec) selenium transferase [Clostridium aceticum]AKL95125.1 L-seryl-tRNA(Sec) selenium transferase SelA [Clostridium aceticum]KJF28004.1 selenocysteine synthase [Clostridium aceticum]